MRFPLKESSISMLASRVSAGLSSNPDVFPAPPATPAQIQTTLDALQKAYDDLTGARAALEGALKAKDELFAQLCDCVKTDLRYAENTVKFSDEKLKLLGWSAPRAKRKLSPPGQVLELKCKAQAPGMISLEWNAPIDGGKVGVYSILRRNFDGGDWQEVSSSLITEALLKDQPSGSRMEYCIAAVNRAGMGTRSNLIEAVL